MDWLTFTIAIVGLLVVAGIAGQALAAWKEVRLADARALLANAVGHDEEDEVAGDVVEVPEPLKRRTH
ncbi:hypothetical protein [Bosea sp. (in: a-proteobacteria)]|uniref:hypothetical protein n=1 Tax=Bosea sp. (in: a-proteobacteria) TaxID=1871050 RepID=UPI002734F2E3|nr:hypothetical protein [Bosea sp. (in: a-proteobacteria)]MDP3408094.1 hypothetical protein [Bosea sp. (in: a-proteobacteria)]